MNMNEVWVMEKVLSFIVFDLWLTKLQIGLAYEYIARRPEAALLLFLGFWSFFAWDEN